MRGRCLTRCAYCGTGLRRQGAGWVDRTGGDACPGDDDLVNENEPHSP